ncbi:MAG: hypothetical protein J4F36_10015 [Nitrosopumilaceae archaeon]|nr:hypothetical protein [Nitrosopumilaceae archaeon]
MTEKCVCGHDSNKHNLGPIEKFNKSFLSTHPVENRIDCKYCECPKFKKKYFWSNPEPYDLRK